MSKRSIIGTIVLIVIVGLGILFTLSNGTSKELPINPKIKHGVLNNGLTYYVLKNQEPKGRASFYIVQNVGAILETDNQNGLAHFLEHMAFNGTENFPKKGILDYFEAYGVTFGRNINAYTKRNETVYNISDVPTSKQTVLDTALLVLHDWSNYLLLEDEEIDAERGVIHEEWRTRNTGKNRIYKEMCKLLYQGSKYAKRDVIGDTNVIDNFKHKLIREFYHDWYRTDLQAIIAVGDFNADTIEAKIKEMFSSIKAVKNPKERFYPEIPDNKKPIVGIITDPEAKGFGFELYFKHESVDNDNKNVEYFKQSLINRLYITMLNARYRELLQKGNPPFIFGFAFLNHNQPKLDVYRLATDLDGKNIKRGIKAILTENERVLRYGFVKTELSRAKIKMLSKYEKEYKERTKQGNDKLAHKIKDKYLTNEPCLGIEAEYELVKKLLPKIKLKELNTQSIKWNTNKNRVFILRGPEKEGLTYLSQKDIIEIYNRVKAVEIKPYSDGGVDKPMITKKLNTKKIIDSKKLNSFNAIEWTLENNAKVVIKTTDFKDDEILLKAYSVGGTSLYPDKDIPSASRVGYFASAFGLGKFDALSLEKKLTGKEVDLNPFIEELSEGFEGSSTVKDFETLLKLQYLMFEQPRFDSEAFDALKHRYVAYVANRGADLNRAFNDTIKMVTTNYNKRTWLFDSVLVNHFDFETMQKVYKERFIDASDFVFVFVGNINLEKAKPLIEKYIGNIKTINRKENWVDNNVNYPDSNIKKNFKVAMKTPKTSIYVDLHGKINYNEKNRIYAGIVKQLLAKKYTEIIREKEGGAYSVKVKSIVNHFPKEELSIIIKFDTDPDKEDKLKKIVYDEIENIYKNKVDTIDFKEVKENLIKIRQEDLRKNSYWINTILQYYIHKEELMNFEDFKIFVNSITCKEIQEFTKQFSSEAIKVEVIMKEQ